MMQRLVDSALGVAKESIKTFSQESFTNFVKVLNGFSALVLAVLPGKTNALAAVTGWEQYPTFRAPRLPKWMEEGVSSFNQFIHDFDFESIETDDESDYGSDVDDEDSAPQSPSSQTSRISKNSSLHRSGSLLRSSTIRRWFRKITWPWRAFLRLLRITGRPQNGHQTSHASDAGRSETGTLRRNNSSSGSFKAMMDMASKRFSDVKDLVINHRTTDSRRRGVVEDLQLGVELFIERVFDIVRRWIHYFLSPFETLKGILKQVFFKGEPAANPSESETVVVQTATLGESDETSKSDRRYNQPLNTDARTCGDFITALGYPYESLKVTTGDGYILSLERIPRPESTKVLYLQHGILDSSLGWVSCGVVGSQAFAAYDQGYDVFLGNFRGLASRDHVNKKISSQRYWKYSVNEHGTQDIPAMLDKVHELKMSELRQLNLLSEEYVGSASETGSTETLPLPYSLCGVAHSLGGAAMLIYLVTRRLEGRRHFMKRAILLSPAGFHEKAPPSCYGLQFALPILAPVLRPMIPGLYIPTKFFRMLFNKLSRDFQNYPALGGLVQTLISYCLGGDSSNWIGAFGMTHYNMEDMPGIALGVALHLSQMMRSKRFMMYDFGSAAANTEAYGTPQPLDIGAHYGVIDIPVDVVAGKKDKLIPRCMVAKHFDVLNEAGVEASYSEFEYAHLDFTFSNRDEVLDYVMSRLLLVEPQRSGQAKRAARRSKSLRERKRRGWDRKLEVERELDGFSYAQATSFLAERSPENGESPREVDSPVGRKRTGSVVGADSEEGKERTSVYSDYDVSASTSVATSCTVPEEITSIERITRTSQGTSSDQKNDFIGSRGTLKPVSQGPRNLLNTFRLKLSDSKSQSASQRNPSIDLSPR